MPRKARPTTPSMMLGPLGSPNSPPQTPTSTTHTSNRKKLVVRHLPTYYNISRPAVLEDSGIQPTGNGHEFSFTPSNRFSRLSPRTSSEESDEEEDSDSESESEQSALSETRDAEDRDEEDSDDDESSQDSEDAESEDEDDDVPMGIRPPGLASAPMSAPMPVRVSAQMFAPMPSPVAASGMAIDDSSEESEEDDEDEDEDSDSEDSESESEILPLAPEASQQPPTPPNPDFTVEELSDFDPMDRDRADTIAPSGFSSPASARSRSRAPAPCADLPHTMMDRMQNLHFTNHGHNLDHSDDDLDADALAHREFVRMQRELKMRKRRSHGSSIGKRTISERSDSDHEDWTPLDADAVGSSARRLRRRVGDRRSFIHLQFQDPPPPRIDEQSEPESEDEGTLFFCDGETLARELPYWSIEIMEYESPSP
ncbi:hypothetical protein CCHL11_10358 [Colletotrichum chlorophyti]|uniref:Uncharacterized protein n=1 Tax=Colletotrichum chlorophyti TaxID=708187 RepID=A0A1Q8R9X6_9PEZI|nr:hypothetical protein CCHL11_10358 [Colletotrichum chlorophyti]